MTRVGTAMPAASRPPGPWERGVVTVEYAVLLGLVSLVGVVCTAGLGIPFLRMFRYAVTIIALPVS